MPDWRTDPGWELALWRDDLLKKRPGDRPAKRAELAQPPMWASLYAPDGQIAATWWRPVVLIAAVRRRS